MFYKAIICFSLLFFCHLSHATWEKLVEPETDFNKPSTAMTVYDHATIFDNNPNCLGLCGLLNLHRAIALARGSAAPLFKNFVRTFYGSYSPNEVDYVVGGNQLALIAGYYGIQTLQGEPHKSKDFYVTHRLGREGGKKVSTSLAKFMKGLSSVTMTMRFEDGEAHDILINSFVTNDTPHYLLADSNAGIYQFDEFSDINDIMTSSYSTVGKSWVESYSGNKYTTSASISTEIPLFIEEAYFTSMYHISQSDEFHEFYNKQSPNIAEWMGVFAMKPRLYIKAAAKIAEMAPRSLMRNFSAPSRQELAKNAYLFSTPILAFLVYQGL
jgi:hypothetical protein